MKMILKLFIIFASISLFAQADESVELKVGDEAPTWALMYAPGKFEFLRNWSEVKIDQKTGKEKKLRLNVSQPDRHAVVMSFFATWCKPCMKELPILEEVYKKYKDERVKFFLIDITEATRNNPGTVYGMLSLIHI